jgi:hypothetical protein
MSETPENRYSGDEAINMLRQLTEAMEEFRSEGRNHQIKMESQLNRLSVIENERNKLFKEALRIQALQLKIQKESFFENLQ